MVALPDAQELATQDYPPLPATSKKPTAAFLYSIIGGAIILLWGALIVDAGVRAASGTFGLAVGASVAIGAAETVLGILVVTFGALLYIEPQRHTTFGILVLVFSIASLVGLGGLLLGFLLGVIGGFRALTYDPAPPAPPTGPPLGSNT
jgi:hypothetical protein